LRAILNAAARPPGRISPWRPVARTATAKR
jgi:hypothetical protein